MSICGRRGSTIWASRQGCIRSWITANIRHQTRKKAKIVQNFHTEFILSGNHLVSEIDPEKDADHNVNGVVNGSSFNYATDNDYRSDKSGEWNALHSDHYKYDMKVNKLDPKFRKKKIDDFGFEAFKTSEYNSSKFPYAEQGSSESKINGRTMDRFKEELAGD
ncbi:MAG: DUF3114 domain-containing protein [Lactobacillus sp.]|jgi:hypothetical protein|nr:DUF3114 domain-containing protein [Lactobacillus sp.]MCI2032311.1 DUF3114 domain-containing protein [Lactobacillus sp.]